MKNFVRHFLRIALPPLFASTAFAIFTAVFEFRHLWDVFVYWGIFALYAYIFAGLPSVLFAVAMSFVEKRHPAPRSRLVAAGALGAAAGIVIGAVFRSPIFIPLGLAVGFAVEWTVLRATKSKPLPQLTRPLD